MDFMIMQAQFLISVLEDGTVILKSNRRTRNTTVVQIPLVK